MTWTKTPPTRAGAYWWRASDKDTDLELCEVFDNGDGLHFWSLPDAARDCDATKLADLNWGGEWAGPLVPVEEVRKAYEEGVLISDDDTTHGGWMKSRARRVVEGEEV